MGREERTEKEKNRMRDKKSKRQREKYIKEIGRRGREINKRDKQMQ